MSINYSGTATTLLPYVKNYLDITWTDDAGDAKLTGIIARGMRYVDSHAGAVQDYTEEGAARQLLFDYCRYARDNALNEFAEGYLEDLTALRAANTDYDAETE